MDQGGWLEEPAVGRKGANHRGGCIRLLRQRLRSFRS